MILQRDNMQAFKEFVGRAQILHDQNYRASGVDVGFVLMPGDSLTKKIVNGVEVIEIQRFLQGDKNGANVSPSS